MKKLRRMLAITIASVMCLSVIGEIPAKAATEKTTDISWFGGQNGNPWNGSDWTFLTGKDGNFSKMENYISNDSTTASIKPGWAADVDANTAYIGTWRQQATQEKWAVTAFDIAEDGNITGTSGQTLKTSGAGSGDVMVVLKNADGFYPVWPTKGEWAWQTVADTTGISVNFTTGYKSGDTLYYIVKPSEGADLTRITICPSLTFVGGTATDYPTAFTAFGGDVEVETEVWENHIGWYVTQATQPWTGSYFTFEYLDLSTNEFKQLETHVADASPAYWQDATGNVVVKGWEHFSTTDKYSAVAFTAGKAGHVKLNTSDGVVKGGIAGGQYAVIQRSGDSYHVLQNWTDVAKGETKTFAEKATYVNEGEVIYYLTRSITSTESANLQINPKVTYTIGAKDTNNLHPSTWGTLNSIVREGKTVDISWFAAQNGNPWPGSPFTFEYFDRAAMEFKKLEDYVQKENSTPFWQDSTGKVQVKTWEQVGTFEKYATVAFTANQDMHVVLESKSGLLEAADEGGQFMLVQRSGDSYHALLDWLTVPANQSITLDAVETYMKAGDIVYFMYRAEKVIYTSSQVVVDYTPQVTYTTGVTDTSNLYPATWGDVSSVIIGDQSAMDAALDAPTMKYNPTEAKYQEGNRFYQGCPDVVVADNGRMWATWMAGGFGEDEDNYVPLYTSMDGGQTWSAPKVVLDVDGPVRLFENQLWMDPDGRLWLFWAQSYYWFDGRCGVWAMYTENPGDENPTWSEPVRLADGVARNNPVVLENGDWILPTALWTWSQNSLLSDVKYANAYISKDKGATWNYLGSVKEYEGERNHDENMIIEQKDGSLRMLIRTMIGIEESYSYDGGKTWTAAKDAGLSATVSRFYIGRLASGNQLLVYNDPDVAGRRSHLTAAISEDDGKTWPYKLVIDERWGTSYPDVQQTADGTIYISYDCGRTSKAELLMAQITEADIKAGQLVTETSKLKFMINNNTTKFAGVETKSGEIKKVEAGATIFSDSDAVFLEELNDWFEGKSYLYGSMEDGFTANVTADGWMYILTPVTGSEYSQQEALEADGYEMIITLPAGKLASTISEPLAVMAKQVEKGETISVEQWALLLAEDISVWNNSIAWYVQQNQQPWSGSYYTFEYFDVTDMSFNQMETYEEDESSSYWQDETGTAIIKAWQQFASNQKYSAVTFTAGEKGVVTLTNNTTVTGKLADGELMLLQRSGDSYAVLMDWVTVPAGQSVTLPNVETYVEAGDIVYYLYRSKSNTTAVLEMVPGVNYVIGVKDSNNQYPTEWLALKDIMGPKVIEDSSLKLSGATLQLENDITVTIKSKASIVGNYKNPYVVVEQELEDGEIKVTEVEGVLNDAGTEYNFFYKGVEAKQVGDSFVATIYAYDEEGNIVKGSAAAAYSAKKYCTSMLAKTAEQIGVSEPRCERFKTLLVDLLNYATEAQKYFGYKEDMYVNADLSTELQAKASSDSVLASLENITLANYETIENPTASFRGATLELQNKVYVKATVLYEGDMTNVKAVFTVDGVAYEVTEYTTSATNTYSFVCDEVTAYQLEEPIYIKIIDGDTVISNTARYSVGSYAARYQTNEKVGPVVCAMMKYGKAADAYISKGDQANVNRDLFYGVCYCAYEAAVWYSRDVDAELQAMDEIGAKSTRMWMRSTHMMSDSQTFKANAVATMKEIIANTQGRGIEVIGMNCNWFSGTDDYMAVPTRNLEADSDYMKFLADYEETWYQMAKKFPEITTWEIGNEWNNDTFLHPLDYKENGTTFTASEKATIATDMLYYASRGIHRGNPNAKTVLGGLVDVYETGYGDAKTFLEMIYANIESGQYSSTNPEDFFQIAAWHPYNHSGTPNAAWVQRQKDIYQVILDHEGHGKTVLFTEMGLSDYGDAERDADQKDDVIATLTLIRNELSFVQSVHWFRMFDDANAESWGGAFETGFGLFTEPDEDGNFEMKAKGEAYLEMTGGK